MSVRLLSGAALGAALVLALPAAAAAQISTVSMAEDVHAGELAVAVNKSQVLRSDRPFAKALIGNPDIADVLPLTDRSLYVLGKKTGTTSLTLYDRRNTLIAVVDVAVGPDVTSLKRQLSELMPDDRVGARMSNDSIILEGIVASGPAADRAVQIAETYAPGKVINLLSIGASQQVMLEVRFSEVRRGAAKQLGLNHSFMNNSGKFLGGIGEAGLKGVPITSTTVTGSNGAFDNNTTTITDGLSSTVRDFGTTSSSSTGSTISKVGSGALGLLLPTGGFGAFGVLSRVLGLNISSALDALETKGLVTTLAEPTLVAMSGETASFLAGGEFPIPVINGGGGGGAGGGNTGITVEFKPFGVSLAFTPTVLADGVINLVVAPEVSSLDPSASVVVNGLRIPGLQVRRAKTVVELRDGESFAMAGLLRKDFQDTVRQFPILGSLPIIGALFRSTGFQKEETELVIIVTPRLVRPVRAGSLKLPTDRATPPNEADLFLLGRTDGAVGVNPLRPTQASPVGRPIGAVAPPLNERVAPAPGGSAALDPKRLEKDYGHVL